MKDITNATVDQRAQERILDKALRAYSCSGRGGSGPRQRLTGSLGYGGLWRVSGDRTVHASVKAGALVVIRRHGCTGPIVAFWDEEDGIDLDVD